MKDYWNCINAKNKEAAEERMRAWIQLVTDSKLKPLVSAAQTVDVNLGKILNYFPDGHTNAEAESFNAKLKGFRALVRGVRESTTTVLGLRKVRELI